MEITWIARKRGIGIFLTIPGRIQSIMVVFEGGMKKVCHTIKKINGIERRKGRNSLRPALKGREEGPPRALPLLLLLHWIRISLPLLLFP